MAGGSSPCSTSAIGATCRDRRDVVGNTVVGLTGSQSAMRSGHRRHRPRRNRGASRGPATSGRWPCSWCSAASRRGALARERESAVLQLVPHHGALCPGLEGLETQPRGLRQCHYPPGFRDTVRVKFQAMTQVAKWATGTYSSKPFAEVEDASCLRSGCHSAAQFEGGATTRGRFNHGAHLDAAKTKQQLRCTSCHSQIVVNRHFEVDRRACFLCHFKGTRVRAGADAGRGAAPGATWPRTATSWSARSASTTRKSSVAALHARSATSRSSTARGEAPRERCLSCHNQPEKLHRYAETQPLIHASTSRVIRSKCRAATVRSSTASRRRSASGGGGIQASGPRT